MNNLSPWMKFIITFACTWLGFLLVAYICSTRASFIPISYDTFFNIYGLITSIIISFLGTFYFMKITDAINWVTELFNNFLR